MRTTGRTPVRVRSRPARDLHGFAAACLIGLLALAPAAGAAPAKPGPKRRPPAAKPGPILEPPKCVMPDVPVDPQGPPEDYYRRGQCDEVDGRLLSALELYQVALRRQPLPPLAQQLQARVVAIIPQLGTLRIEASAWPPGTLVRIGARALEPGAKGPQGGREWVDPGRVEIEVEAPGFKKERQLVEIAKGEEKVVALPPPTPLPSGSSPAPAPSALGPALAVSPAALRPAEGGPILRPIGYVSLAVGGAALLAGGVTGYLAIDRGRVVRSECPTPSTCSSGGAAAANAGASFSTASTIAIIGGAVVTLGALALIVFGGPKPKAIAGFVFLGGG